MLTALLGLAMALEPKPLTADDLAWMAGTWVQEADGQRIEETWTKPEANTLFGVNRTSKDGVVGFHEFLRIEPRDGVLAYVALPKGAKKETAFAAAEHGEGWVRFANPKHDFPKSIAYRLVDQTLHIEVRGDEGKGFDLDLVRSGPDR